MAKEPSEQPKEAQVCMAMEATQYRPVVLELGTVEALLLGSLLWELETGDLGFLLEGLRLTATEEEQLR